VLPAVTAEQEEDKFAETQFVVKPLYESVQVQTQCGEFFGYNEYSNVERCISFNYESDDNIFIRTVAISTLKTEIDNGKNEPTVQFSSPSVIIIRISKADYDKEKDCLPEPAPQQ
jgi:hypothetical protein